MLDIKCLTKSTINSNHFKQRKEKMSYSGRFQPTPKSNITSIDDIISYLQDLGNMLQNTFNKIKQLERTYENVLRTVKIDPASLMKSFSSLKEKFNFKDDGIQKLIKNIKKLLNDSPKMEEEQKIDYYARFKINISTQNIPNTTRQTFDQMIQTIKQRDKEIFNLKWQISQRDESLRLAADRLENIQTNVLNNNQSEVNRLNQEMIKLINQASELTLTNTKLSKELSNLSGISEQLETLQLDNQSMILEVDRLNLENEMCKQSKQNIEKKSKECYESLQLYRTNENLVEQKNIALQNLANLNNQKPEEENKSGMWWSWRKNIPFISGKNENEEDNLQEQKTNNRSSSSSKRKKKSSSRKKTYRRR